MQTTYDVTIVGAGMAGLAAARELIHGGLTILILDKGRQVGGRMATRRIQGAAFDTGAQFFTAVSPEFRGLVEAAGDDGAVAQWYQRPPRREDEKPLAVWRGNTGMTDLPKWIAADLRKTETVDLRTETRVTRIEAGAERIHLFTESEELAVISTDAVILTPPAPQALELLSQNLRDHFAGGETAGGIGHIHYDPCLALLIALESSLPGVLNEYGWLRPSGSEGMIAWIADNTRKMHSAAEEARPARLTVHSSPAAAERLYKQEESQVVGELIDELMKLLPAKDRAALKRAQARDATELKRWRYARPTGRGAELSVAVRRNVVLAGDSFGGGRVEGAFASGHHAASRILRRYS